MAAITSNKALQDMEKGKFAPIYWIWGEEAFFTDKLLATLKKKVVTAAPDFNFDNLDAGPPAKASMSQVVGAASSHPTMAPRRLVLVKGADSFKADDLDALSDYASNPLETSVLCFVSTGGKKPDLRRKAFKAIDKLGGLVECKPVREREIPAWVDRMAKERGMNVARGAVDVLVQYIGTDLLAIDQTIEKASLLVENPTELTEELAQEAVSLSRHRDVFEVFNAAVAGRREDAVTGLRRLYTDGEKAAGLLPGLWWQFKRLWLAAEMVANGKRRPEISQTVGGGRPMAPWALDQLARQVVTFDADRCRQVAARFTRLDRLAKGGSHFPEIELEHLLLEMSSIAGKKARPRR